MHQVALIPGDWIGPETVAATKQIIETLGVQIDWVELIYLRVSQPKLNQHVKR